MLKINDVNFIKSVVDLKDKPNPHLPEFAFAGRSNVGKSSLINCLVNRKNIAKVSKQPGKTRTINYFSINEKFYLVDLPGYGFARVSATEKENWRRMIESYLLNSSELKMLFLIIDFVVGPQKNDLQLIEWLQYTDIPTQIIATKLDKLGINARIKQERIIRQKLHLTEKNKFFVFSSKTKFGRKELLGQIGQILT